MSKIKFREIVLILIGLIILITSINFALGDDSKGVQYCCEKTSYGAWCQEVSSQDNCDSNYKSVPTSCEATSFCKLGCCYDSDEGTCMESTPQKVCEESEGTWDESKECEIDQCNLGCCVLGSQAAYVTQTRCKKLSGFYGLTTDFRTNINDELSCIAIANLQDKGACVFDLDYAKDCKFGTRQECDNYKKGEALDNGTITSENITFYKDYLCSAEELGTNCGRTEETTCVDGKDEVYFKDSCGNPANIYDASLVDDTSYWNKIVTKEESCGYGEDNAASKTCGNCDYFSGSICAEYSNTKPDYGENICKDLNCYDTVDNVDKKHGESWCYTDANEDSVGSRYFRHICMNGEEIIEPCSDFRQEYCVAEVSETSEGEFSQAGCIVNRWQDCYSQTEQDECEDTDKRDCVWDETGIFQKIKVDEEGVSSIDNSSREVACVPLHAPGLEFWSSSEGNSTSTGSSEAQGICSVGSSVCKVEYEINIAGTEKCVKNCDCLEDSWKTDMITKCSELGDCGYKINIEGEYGQDTGYDIESGKTKREGLFGLSLILNKLRITGQTVQEINNTGEGKQ